MSADKAKRKNEVTVLLHEVEVGGFFIKPWSFGRFKKVYPSLLGIIPALKGLDLTPETAQEMLAAQGPGIIGDILPMMTGLIAATLDIPEADVDEMAFDQAATIGLVIVSQNIERIKNSLPLITEQIKTMIRGI